MLATVCRPIESMERTDDQMGKASYRDRSGNRTPFGSFDDGDGDGSDGWRFEPMRRSSGIQGSRFPRRV